MEQQNKHFLYPSCLFVSKQPFEVKTILGSCVSVCLWDKALGYGGINHYLLPFWNGNSLPSPKYGNIAIQKLIEKMLSMGCQHRNLIAKVFGGSNQFSHDGKTMNIGLQNILLAKETLKEEKIPLISEHTGGKNGRMIVFYTATGEILLKSITSNILNNQSV